MIESSNHFFHHVDILCWLPWQFEEKHASLLKLPRSGRQRSSSTSSYEKGYLCDPMCLTSPHAPTYGNHMKLLTFSCCMGGTCWFFRRQNNRNSQQLPNWGARPREQHVASSNVGAFFAPIPTSLQGLENSIIPFYLQELGSRKVHRKSTQGRGPQPLSRNNSNINQLTSIHNKHLTQTISNLFISC